VQLARRLRSVALSLTGSSESAEELTQQTLAHMLARDAEFIFDVPYVRKVMLRLWLNEQRSLRRRLERSMRFARMPRSSFDATEWISQSEQVALVQRAIAKLPALQRAVLVLRVMEEMSYEHIADVVESSVEAVRANLHLARKAVRRACGEDR
jgi:RNA polymerase sigma-70 factor (ECF subfamily)